MNNNIFWTEKPSILYEDEKYLEFIPTKEMSRTDQLNAITRFLFYYLVIVIILKKEEQWIHLGIVIMLFVVILFYTFNADKKGKQDELLRQKGLITKKENKNKDFQIESGYYDSNNKLHIGKYYGSQNKNINDTKINYSMDDFEKYEKEIARKPTIDNPFMNPLQTDFNIENPPVASNADDTEISNDINTKFNDNLFRDVSDVFGRENSQRQFYTVPQMNPPDTHAFAMWLYGNQNVCKTDQSKCMKYTDLRYNGGNIGNH